jgi:aarF domain-containing kinase
MKEELTDECNYSREASFISTFRSPDYLGEDHRFRIPWVWNGSTNRVLVMEHLNGISVGEAEIGSLSQQDRNDVSTSIDSVGKSAKIIVLSDRRSYY